MEVQETKLSLEERVSKKMGLAKWIHELYYQNAELFQSQILDIRVATVLQTSGNFVYILSFKSIG